VTRARVSRRRVAGLLAGAVALPRLARAAPAKLRVAMNLNAADLPYFIAQEKGLFAEQNLDVELINFKSTTEMMPQLSSGGIDVGGGGATAGLYNAVGRGLNLRLVADKASATSPEYSPLMLLVRRKLIDSGAVRTLADLKGKKFGNISPGGSGESLTEEFLKTGGLRFEDVDSVYLPPPQLAAAFENGALDASIMTEPSSSVLVKRGVAKLWARCGDVYPGMQVASIFYGKTLLENRALGQAFMDAYIKAARVYNDSLADGAFAGARGDEIVRILAKYTGQTDIGLIRGATPHGLDPDGGVHMASLEKDLAFFQRRNLVEARVSVADVVDNSFAQEAARRLGPYKRPAG
jgi:NitT/TauT family transport system substrate-binding protein